MALVKEELAPLLDPVRELMDEPIPQGVGWTHVFGALLLGMTGIMFVTGILLALVYSPSVGSAWESVRYIENRVWAGGFIRSLHHWSAAAFVLLVVVHMIRVVLYGAYKGKRRWTWVAGMGLFVTVMGLSFTGMLLPWDMKAYFGTLVGTNIAASAPVVGESIKTLLLGGPTLGPLTLARFYSLHVIVLPLGLLAMLAIHLMLIRGHGITPPGMRIGTEEDTTYSGPFYPRQAAKESLALVGLIAVLFLVAWQFSIVPEEGAKPVDPVYPALTAEWAKANPTDTSYVPYPEWYFFGAQQLLRIFSGPLEILGSFILPNLFLLLLLLLPFIDRNPERSPKKRPVVMAGLVLCLLSILGLTGWGAAEIDAEKARLNGEILKQGPGPSANLVDRPADPKLYGRGLELYTLLACESCHGAGFGPSLSHEASKVRLSWLRTYLKAPHRIRYSDQDDKIWPDERMPDFQLSSDDIEGLVSFIVSEYTDTGKIPDSAINWTTTTPEQLVKGKDLFRRKMCRSCHVQDGKGTEVGPSLEHAGRRLRGDYLFALIKDPNRIFPGSSMAENAPKDLPEEEVELIVRFLTSLK